MDKPYIRLYVENNHILLVSNDDTSLNAALDIARKSGAITDIEAVESLAGDYIAPSNIIDAGESPDRMLFKYHLGIRENLSAHHIATMLQTQLQGKITEGEISIQQ